MDNRRLPTLTPEQLQTTLEQLQRRDGISQQGRDNIRRMLAAASNPASQDLDVLLEQLPAARRELIAKGAKAVRRREKTVTNRARKELLAMSEAEWQSLVDEAAQDD
jgi:vacuolar-type H+-ATPase subunit H